MNKLMTEVRKNEPGRYFTDAELQQLTKEEPSLAPRLRAARAAQAAEAAIVKAAVDASLRKYDFQTGRAGFGPAKCYRDVGNVFRYCVFAMVYDDRSLLEDKLLLWLRTILQSLSFPESTQSIRFTYAGLRKEAQRQLSAEDAALLDPFLRAAEEILPSPNP